MRRAIHFFKTHTAISIAAIFLARSNFPLTTVLALCIMALLLYGYKNTEVQPAVLIGE